MKIQLVTPAPLKINNGNKITAVRWAGILKKLGHRVRVSQSYDGKPCELLIALHARRSYDSIQRFHDSHPNSPLIVVLTGTDVYRDIHSDAKAQRSLELASRLVALQKMALRELPRRLHKKTEVIYQSAEPFVGKPNRANGDFKVYVVGHLREEKDPLRTAFAVRRLPRTSRIQVTHIGQALDEQLRMKAAQEVALNPRYRWIGQLSHRKTREQLAQSQLVCITSKMEGSSNVLSEALASGVPVICTKISGLIGTLGSKFSGYYPVGKTKQLRKILLKAESDPRFYASLKRYCENLAYLVEPQREIDAWRRLIRQLT
ncbi:MAG: TIGR04348 family glycosyltransferase [Deltaproteobacteria bacterium]|nr:TIGR04348 family glycosyltransferase [Deltaproteobacteria bacterium]